MGQKTPVKPRINGHERGSETVRTIVRTCRQIGISYLTLYAFSTENWQRPKVEVEALMALLKKFLQSERKEMVENNIRLRAIGQLDRLPNKVREALDQNHDGHQRTHRHEPYPGAELWRPG